MKKSKRFKVNLFQDKTEKKYTVCIESENEYKKLFLGTTQISILLVVAVDTLSLSLSLSLKSRRHVVAIFLARVLCRLVVEEARFRMRVTLGVFLIRSLVNTKHVPGRLRSGSGVALN